MLPVEVASPHLKSRAGREGIMKEYLQDKLFIGFLIFVAGMCTFVGLCNRYHENKKQNEIVEKE